MSKTMTRAMRKAVRTAQGRHNAEPTCDNCGLMTVRSFKDGTAHRHCDLLGLYIPDCEQFATCGLHTWQNRTSSALARKGVKWEKGGRA